MLANFTLWRGSAIPCGGNRFGLSKGKDPIEKPMVGESSIIGGR